MEIFHYSYLQFLVFLSIGTSVKRHSSTVGQHFQTYKGGLALKGKATLQETY